jgi:hypothetical protein
MQFFTKKTSSDKAMTLILDDCVAQSKRIELRLACQIRRRKEE